jgi:hypothetical protein
MVIKSTAVYFVLQIRFCNCTQCFLHASSCFLSCIILQPWRWGRHVPPKGQLTFTRLHNVVSQKTELFIPTAVRTSKPCSTSCLTASMGCVYYLPVCLPTSLPIHPPIHPSINSSICADFHLYSNISYLFYTSSSQYSSPTWRSYYNALIILNIFRKA